MKPIRGIFWFAGIDGGLEDSTRQFQCKLELLDEDRLGGDDVMSSDQRLVPDEASADHFTVAEDSSADQCMVTEAESADHCVVTEDSSADQCVVTEAESADQCVVTELESAYFIKTEEEYADSGEDGGTEVANTPGNRPGGFNKDV